jgi:hypothetical protein
MEYKEYIVKVQHSEKNFTANVVINGVHLQAHLTRFKEIEDFYVIQLSEPYQLRYLQKLKFKNLEHDILVILPLFSKYNNRKLKKISALFERQEIDSDKRKIILKFLSVELFLDIQSILSFLEINEEDALELLLKMAIRKDIKLIRLLGLKVTLYSNYLMLLDKFYKIVESKLESSSKTFDISEVESKLKIKSNSLFFKYLFTKLHDKYSLKISKRKIIFDQIVLSEDQKIVFKKVNEAIKNASLIFTFEDIVKLSDESFRNVNDALWHLIAEEEKVVQLDHKNFLLKEEYNKLINRLKKYKRNQSEYLSIQDFRELTQLNRKTIIILFEAFDRKRITSRVGNKRQILLEV